MAGSLEKSEYKYFEQVALGIVNNKEYDNQIYMLVHDVDDKATFQITEKAPNLFTIQIPRKGETAEQTKN